MFVSGLPVSRLALTGTSGGQLCKLSVPGGGTVRILPAGPDPDGGCTLGALAPWLGEGSVGTGTETGGGGGGYGM